MLAASTNYNSSSPTKKQKQSQVVDVLNYKIPDFKGCLAKRASSFLQPNEGQ